MVDHAPGWDRWLAPVILGLMAGGFFRVWYEAWHSPRGSYAAMSLSVFPLLAGIVLLGVTMAAGVVQVMEAHRATGYRIFVGGASALVGWLGLSIV